MMASTRTPFFEAQVEPNGIEDMRRWVNAQVQHGVSRFVLFNRREKQPVEEWTVSEVLDLGSLATLIFSVAEREANALRESVPYMIYSVRAEAATPASRFAFRIDAGGGGGAAWTADQETPDDRGTVGMLMRHADMSARLSLGASRGIMDQYDKLIGTSTAHLSQLLEQAHRRIEVLEEREARATDLREQLATQAHAHNERMKELTTNAENQKHLIDSLAPLAPAFLSMAMNRQRSSVPPAPLQEGTGGSAPGTSGPSPSLDLHPDLALFDGLVKSVEPHQLMRLSGILLPDQAGVFQVLMAHSMERIQEAAERAARQAPTASVEASAPASPTPAPLPVAAAPQAAPGPGPAVSEASEEQATNATPTLSSPPEETPTAARPSRKSKKTPVKGARRKS